MFLINRFGKLIQTNANERIKNKIKLIHIVVIHRFVFIFIFESQVLFGANLLFTSVLFVFIVSIISLVAWKIKLIFNWWNPAPQSDNYLRFNEHTMQFSSVLFGLLSFYCSSPAVLVIKINIDCIMNAITLLISWLNRSISLNHLILSRIASSNWFACSR